MAELGSPRPDGIKYSNYELEGIKIFVDSNIKVKDDTLIIKRGKILFHEFLTPYNIIPD